MQKFSKNYCILVKYLLYCIRELKEARPLLQKQNCLCIFTALFNARKKTAFFRAFFQAIRHIEAVRARGRTKSVDAQKNI